MVEQHPWARNKGLRIYSAFKKCARGRKRTRCEAVMGEMSDTREFLTPRGAEKGATRWMHCCGFGVLWRVHFFKLYAV